MFFISWGSKWKYERREGGLIVDKLCPSCHKYGEFSEVVPIKYFTLFWVPIFQTEKKQAVLECPNCQARFYIQANDYNGGKKNRAGIIEMPPSSEKTPKAPVRETNCIFECEQCLQKLRVPKKQTTIIVRCPKCSNRFIVKNGVRIKG